MINFKNKFLILFLFIFFIFGSFNSLKNGISMDEVYEDYNWKLQKKIALNAINHFVFNKKFEDRYQKEFESGYLGYGIGFQIISQPIQYFVKNFLNNDSSLDDQAKVILSKHFVVFLFFFISGIFFYLILRKIIDNEIFCSLSLIIYLTYPYLLGQSLFSPKDSPFMSIWLICTYFNFFIFEKLISKQNIKFSTLFIFSFLTAYLFSIRIAGILILIQYFISLILFLNITNFNFIRFIKKYFKELIFFTLALLICTFVLNPPFWSNPLLVLDTIEVMSHYHNNVGTMTFGKVMYATDLPPTYLLIWLSVKLPILIIIGIFLLPFSEKKIFNNNKTSIFFGTLLLSTIIIPLLLILRQTHLYDEIRHIMFLLPLIFIISLVSVYKFSKKIFYFLSTLTICLFLIENIKINPYQYVWFNLPSRTLDLTNKFELEYQGLGGREISKYLQSFENQELCILANPIHGVKPFLNNTKFNCFDIWQKVDTDYPRPFLAVQTVRNLKKSMPYNCSLIYETNFKLLFHKEEFTTGKLLLCK